MNKLALLTSAFCAILQIRLIAAAEMKCVQTGPCLCAIDSNRAIDLTYLANEVKTPPRFKNIPDPTSLDSYFFYHPCEGFYMGTSSDSKSCRQPGGVAVCHQYKNGSEDVSESFGKPNPAPFQYNLTKDMFQLNYTDGNKSTIILLKCAERELGSFLTVDQQDNRTCYMTLTSRCACINGCIPSGLSAGSILVILFTVGVFLYLVGGMLYRYCVCGAQGLEIVPNYEFWFDFPFLVRDGIVFALKCCRTEPTYDRI